MAKESASIKDSKKEADKLCSIERGYIQRLNNIQEKVSEKLKDKDTLERVKEFIFNKDIPYEDNPLAEFRK